MHAPLITGQDVGRLVYSAAERADLRPVDGTAARQTSVDPLVIPATVNDRSPDRVGARRTDRQLDAQGGAQISRRDIVGDVHPVRGAHPQIQLVDTGVCARKELGTAAKNWFAFFGFSTRSVTPQLGRPLAPDRRFQVVPPSSERNTPPAVAAVGGRGEHRLATVERGRDNANDAQTREYAAWVLDLPSRATIDRLIHPDGPAALTVHVEWIGIGLNNENGTVAASAGIDDVAIDRAEGNRANGQ